MRAKRRLIDKPPRPCAADFGLQPTMTQQKACRAGERRRWPSRSAALTLFLFRPLSSADQMVVNDAQRVGRHLKRRTTLPPAISLVMTSAPPYDKAPCRQARALRIAFRLGLRAPLMRGKWPHGKGNGISTIPGMLLAASARDNAIIGLYSILPRAMLSARR